MHRSGPYPVHALTVDEIRTINGQYREAASRSLDAGYEWIEMHFAHGYLGATFWSHCPG